MSPGVSKATVLLLFNGVETGLLYAEVGVAPKKVDAIKTKPAKNETLQFIGVTCDLVKVAFYFVYSIVI